MLGSTRSWSMEGNSEPDAAIHDKKDQDVRHRHQAQQNVISNYKGKVGQTLGVIQVDLTVSLITRPTMLMVIIARANYNLMLGRE